MGLIEISDKGVWCPSELITAEVSEKRIVCALHKDKMTPAFKSLVEEGKDKGTRIKISTKLINYTFNEDAYVEHFNESEDGYSIVTFVFKNYS